MEYGIVVLCVGMFIIMSGVVIGIIVVVFKKGVGREIFFFNGMV